jgi:GT2 family glycosyltransferase
MMSNLPPKVSVLIPHWNAGDQTIKCLDQISKWDFPLEQLEIIVQDNGSTDGSSELIRQTVDSLRLKHLGRWIFRRLEKHPGLTASLNLALDLVSPDTVYLLRLDNDVFLASDALSSLVIEMEKESKIGVCGPRFVYDSDPTKFQAGAIWIDWWGLRGLMEDPSVPVECDSLLGGAMLVRKEAVERLGRWFEPSFFLFHEEGEFCQAIKQLGYSTLYVPYAQARHRTALSTYKHSDLCAYLSAHNYISFIRKYASPLQRCLNYIIQGVLALRWWIQGRGLVRWWGFWDGLLGRPLNADWWQFQIVARSFSRPKGKT